MYIKRTAFTVLAFVVVMELLVGCSTHESYYENGQLKEKKSGVLFSEGKEINIIRLK